MKSNDQEESMTTNTNRIGRSSRTTNGKIHKLQDGVYQHCNYSGQVRSVSTRSFAKPADLTHANACGKCWDTSESRHTLTEQAALYTGEGAS
jgi:hypothetical protein